MTNTAKIGMFIDMAKVSITDVAAEAHVAISTASKALNGTGSIGKDTVERVMAAAKRLGYRPNRAAQMLAGKQKKIGILIPDFPDQIISCFEAGIADAMEEYASFGFRHTLFRYDNRTQGDAAFFDGLELFARKELVDGLIFTPSCVSSVCRDRLMQLSIPKLSLQIRADPTICTSVTVDEPMVGRMAAEFLSLFGTIRSTGVIVGERNIAIHKMNLEGYASEAAARGLELTAVADSYNDMNTAYYETESMLQNFPQIQGIFVSSYVAPAVCSCIRDRGKAGDIRVIGVDVYKETAECLACGLLSAIIYQNQREQGRQSIRQMVSLLLDEPTESIRIKPELVMNCNLSFYYTP